MSAQCRYVLPPSVLFKGFTSELRTYRTCFWFQRISAELLLRQASIRPQLGCWTLLVLEPDSVHQNFGLDGIAYHELVVRDGLPRLSVAVSSMFATYAGVFMQAGSYIDVNRLADLILLRLIERQHIAPEAIPRCLSNIRRARLLALQRRVALPFCPVLCVCRNSVGGVHTRLTALTRSLSSMGTARLLQPCSTCRTT